MTLQPAATAGPFGVADATARNLLACGARRRQRHELGMAGAGLGRPATGRRTADPVPALVPGASGATEISAGGQHVLTLTSSGRVLAWGEENAGQVGHAAPGRPGSVATIANARAVHAIGLSSFATLADGTIMVWESCRPCRSAQMALMARPRTFLFRCW